MAGEPIGYLEAFLPEFDPPTKLTAELSFLLGFSGIMEHYSITGIETIRCEADFQGDGSGNTCIL